MARPRGSGRPSPPPLRVVSTQPVDRPPTALWSQVAVVAPDTLDVHYLEGSPDCDVLVNVRVAESANDVTVTLVTGHPVGGPDACALVGHSARTRVTLRTPLGTRPVLDGHATPPTPREVRR